MTKEEAIRLLNMGRLAYNEVEAEAFCEAYDRAIKALKAEPCEDCISRQAVLDLLHLQYFGKDLYMKIATMPSVTPAPKIGHWVDVEPYGGCECSECGRLEGAYSDYYPNCGAKMEE